MKRLTIIVHVKDGYEGIADLLADKAWEEGLNSGVGAVIDVDVAEDHVSAEEEQQVLEMARP